MEIKAYRDDEKQFDDREKMNLFLKDRTWTDAKTSIARIRDYGDVNSSGRWAWCQHVTCKVSERGLQLRMHLISTGTARNAT